MANTKRREYESNGVHFFCNACFWTGREYSHVHFSLGFCARRDLRCHQSGEPTDRGGRLQSRLLLYSFDDGYSWTEGELTSPFGVWGDPVVLFDNEGILFYAHLSNPPSGNWIDRIVVQRSGTGGVTWDNGVGIGLDGSKAQDKEWLAVDRTQSQFRNNVYLAWTQFDSYGSTNPTDSSIIRFTRMTDQGIIWSEPIRISDTAGDCIDDDNTVEGAVPAVGPNGEVYMAWSGQLGIMFDRSFDGGQTFGRDIFVTDQPGGWGFDIPGIYRCNGLPVTACDISQSLYRGPIYVLWSDQRHGLVDTDVFIVHSDDHGETWSLPHRVNNDDSQRHQFFSWMAIDQSNGNLYVVFYDRRETNNDDTDVFMAVSTNGGTSFTNHKISESSFSPKPTIFFW
jgi:hypothetical protein